MALAKEKDCTIAQIALAFIANSPMNVFPISGVANREEMMSSIAAVDIVLTQKDLNWLDLKSDLR
jgi:aryl-alcohol dehydrogenase-like predicted oxidoreductase